MQGLRIDRTPEGSTDDGSRPGSGRLRGPRVARFALAGLPRPPVTYAVRIAEIMRLAALARFGWSEVPGTGIRRPKAPPEISGRGPDGQVLRDREHHHVFWLPEDADDDGAIDHLNVWLPSGFPRELRERLDGMTRLWTPGSASPAARREWRLALEAFAEPDDFAPASRLFGSASVWQSASVFLASGRIDRRGYGREVRRLLRRRGLVPDDVAERVDVQVIPSLPAGGTDLAPADFLRARSRGREARPDGAGAFLRLSFPEPVGGPVALGYASHFGLGLFRRADEEQA